jgi:hypothetical protein
MPTIKPTRILLAATALLACTPGKGDSASDTDPSTGGTATTTSSTSLTGTGGHTSTSDPSTGATSTSTGDDANPTPGPTTGPTTEIGSTSTGHVTTHPGTTTTGDEPCGSGWCTTKDVLNIILYDNHEPPHELEISAVDAALCVEQTFEFTGPADHTHTVTFTAEHFAIMDVGGSIEVESSEAQGHTHKVWSDCE